MKHCKCKVLSHFSVCCKNSKRQESRKHKVMSFLDEEKYPLQSCLKLRRPENEARLILSHNFLFLLETGKDWLLMEEKASCTYSVVQGKFLKDKEFFWQA